jgi:hypothetical protein
MKYRVIIILLSVSNVISIFAFIFLYQTVKVGNFETGYMLSYYENKYELFSKYIYDENSDMRKTEILEKHDLSDIESKNDYVIINGVYFYFDDDRLVSVE